MKEGGGEITVRSHYRAGVNLHVVNDDSVCSSARKVVTKEASVNIDLNGYLGIF